MVEVIDIGKRKPRFEILVCPECDGDSFRLLLINDEPVVACNECNSEVWPDEFFNPVVH